MEQEVNAIKAQVEKCIREKDMFTMPTIESATIKEKQLEPGGATLVHTGYEVTCSDGSKINIDYQSKDRCRSFEVRPDRSVIDVRCSDPSYDFSDSWDEKY